MSVVTEKILATVFKPAEAKAVRGPEGPHHHTSAAHHLKL